jgi:hypothetical protein
MKNLSLLSIILVICISCSKSNSSNPCMDKSLIRQIKSGDLAQQQFNYNENCQLSENIETYRYTRYTYDQSNRLIKSEEAMSLNPASCYMPQGIEGETISDPRKAKISSYSIMEYDSFGKLTTKSYYNCLNPL